MKNDQIVYLKNIEEKGAEPRQWQHDGQLYTIAPGETQALPYYLANHAIKSLPISKKWDEVFELLAQGQQAAFQSMADVAKNEADAMKAQAKAMVEAAQQKDLEAKRLAAQAKAGDAPKTPAAKGETPPKGDDK